jgi:hypothetical protein
MAVSSAVRAYYAERILAQSGRDRAPRNFTPLTVSATGFATVEGCRGGGKNILEVSLVGREHVVDDIRMSCGLCNPAMYAAADIVADWTRGRGMAEILDLDPLEIDALGIFWEHLGGRGRPDDAREKFQYAVLAVQRAVRDHQGEPTLPVPLIDAPTDRDWDDPDLDPDGE